MLIEADLAPDLDVESGILRHRSARWLRVRILGLLHADTRLARSFQPEPREQVI